MAKKKLTSRKSDSDEMDVLSLHLGVCFSVCPDSKSERRACPYSSIRSLFRFSESPSIVERSLFVLISPSSPFDLFDIVLQPIYRFFL